MAEKRRNREPRVAVKQASAELDTHRHRWNVAWLLKNSERYPLHIRSLRLPHDQFKSEGQSFDPALDVNGGGDVEIRTFVRCDEPAGHVTDNAFAIFDVIWLDEPWRIFVRLRVVVNADGKPEAETQMITAQKVGFSSLTS